jgi:hypothetical protein
MLVFKTVKPKRLKDKAIRLTLLNAMRRAGTQVRKEFEKTTKTWDEKPKFETAVSLTGPGPVLMVATDDKVYNWVNNGTNVGKPKYPIIAGYWTGKSQARALRFQGTYTAKTVPGVIGSRNGGPSGDVVTRVMVMHPGIEPRHFDEDIEKLWQPRFKRLMEEAMKDAAKESGHGG